MSQRPPPDPVHIASIVGETGELLAAMWSQGLLPARVRVSHNEVQKYHGYGVEIFRDRHTSDWTLIPVNHPWTGNEEPDHDRPTEHDLGIPTIRRPRG